MLRKINFFIYLSIIIFSLFFTSFYLHSQFEQSVKIICKIMDEDGNPLPGVAFWYEEDITNSNWIKAHNVSSRETNHSLDYYGTVGSGYPNIFRGKLTNHIALLRLYIPSDSSRRILIRLTKSGYKEIKDSIHVKGTDYYGVCWYKVYIMKEHHPWATKIDVKRSTSSNTWQLYAYCNCMRCTQQTYVDGEYIKSTGYSDTNYVRTFRGKHRITIKRECDGVITTIYNKTVNPPSGSRLTVILESGCSSGRLRIQ